MKTTTEILTHPGALGHLCGLRSNKDETQVLLTISDSQNVAPWAAAKVTPTEGLLFLENFPEDTLVKIHH